VTAAATTPRRRRGRAERFAPLRALSLILPIAWSGHALAQVAVTAAVDSDYRIRGVSFSDGRPAASLSLSYDHGDGLYVSATGVAGQTDSEGVKPLGYQANLGYAVRTRRGWSLDLGVSTAGYTQYLYPRRRLSYSEVYAGVSTGAISAHLYWSPDYLGQHVQTLYGEVDAAVALRPNLKLFGHAGLLAPLDGQPASPERSPRYDLQAGVALAVGPAERAPGGEPRTGRRRRPARLFPWRRRGHRRRILVLLSGTCRAAGGPPGRPPASGGRRWGLTAAGRGRGPDQGLAVNGPCAAGVNPRGNRLGSIVRPCSCGPRREPSRRIEPGLPSRSAQREGW
jgi:uncharacterized protein (TIGR02001 family)